MKPNPDIDWQACLACDPCLAQQVCKTRAILKVDPDAPAFLDRTRCTGCSLCILACCCSAISMNSGGIGVKG